VRLVVAYSIPAWVSRLTDSDDNDARLAMKLLTLCVLGSALLACTRELSKSPASEPLLPDTVVANTAIPLPVAVVANPATPLPDSVAVKWVLSLPDSAVAKSVPDSSTRPPMSWSDSLHAFEVAAIVASGGKVSRTNYWELRIKLLTGRTLVFKTDSTIMMSYRYAGYQKEIHSHVVHRVPYEDSGNYLVVDDSTGDSTTVWAMPVPSPDGTRFVLTSIDEDEESDVGNISVWRIVGRKPQKEFSINDGGWRSSDAVWRDSVAIDFMRNTNPDPDNPFRYIKTPARLTRSGTTSVLPDKRQ
jgi:hypothetical protein